MRCAMFTVGVTVNFMVCPRCCIGMAGLIFLGTRLQNAFKDLQNPKELYLAITTEDASVVYYKISQGIVKPPV